MPTTPNYCKTVYNSGQCIKDTEFEKWADSFNLMLKAKARDAEELISILNYLPIWSTLVEEATSSQSANYFRRLRQKGSSRLLVISSSVFDTFWDTTKTEISNMISKLSKYFKELFEKSSDSINSCLVSYFEIANGVMCYATSKKQSEGESKNTDLKIPGSIV